jgi:SPP1 family predicted phage head-tail adaptor
VTRLSILNQRAALQANTLAPDGGGGYIAGWQTFSHAWVKVTALGASERFAADARESRIRHRIELRSRDDVVAGQRLVTGGRTFHIHAVLERSDSERLMTLLCEELP